MCKSSVSVGVPYGRLSSSRFLYYPFTALWDRTFVWTWTRSYTMRSDCQIPTTFSVCLCSSMRCTAAGLRRALSAPLYKELVPFGCSRSPQYSVLNRLSIRKAWAVTLTNNVKELSRFQTNGLVDSATLDHTVYVVFADEDELVQLAVRQFAVLTQTSHRLHANPEVSGRVALCEPQFVDGRFRSGDCDGMVEPSHSLLSPPMARQ